MQTIYITNLCTKPRMKGSLYIHCILQVQVIEGRAGLGNDTRIAVGLVLHA